MLQRSNNLTLKQVVSRLPCKLCVGIPKKPQHHFLLFFAITPNLLELGKLELLITIITVNKEELQHPTPDLRREPHLKSISRMSFQGGSKEIISSTNHILIRT
ncbi:hypothetical protein BT93_K1844 [Corymbia citriodora subsp. variegata]|nr:hypothetical protein BT93_K1844 [Corymbia citriodora subsp. variegata]